MSEKAPVKERIAELERQLDDARFEEHGRPTEVNGVLEDVDGNRPVFAKDADIYFQRQRNKQYDQTMPDAYEDMSVTEVAKELARAEFEADKTKIEDLSDVLADKLASAEDKTTSSRDSAHNGDRSDNLWNRVMGVKDAEFNRLSNELDADNIHTLSNAMDIKRDRSGVGRYGAKLQELEEGIRKGARAMGLKGEELEDFVASKVTEIDENDLDGINTKQLNAEKTRLDEIRDEILAIKKGQAQRWAKKQSDEGYVYDSEFEDSQDERVKELLMEAYGTDDPEDPRVMRAIEALDEDEDVLAEKINGAGKEVVAEPGSREELVAKLEEANKAQEEARIEFARLNANRRAKTYTRNGAGFSKEDLDAALNKWVAAREKAGELAAGLLKSDGHSDEAIKELFSPAGYLYEATELARLTMEFEAEAAGRKISEITEDGQVIFEENSAEQTKRGKLQRKFYDFWARSGKITKTAITAGAGLALGLAAAPVIATGGVAATATILGTKISKNLAVARINKKANGRTVSLRSEQAFFNKVNQISQEAESTDAVPSSEMLGSQLSAVTNETVRGNRRRVALMAGGIIGGAVVGNFIHGQFGGGGSDEHGFSSSSTTVNEQQSGGSGGSAVETAANHRVGGRVSSTLNEQTSGINTSEVPTASPAIPVSEFNHIDTSGYRVPYSWAEQEFGRVNAMNQLRELAEKARQDGHSIEWHGSGTNEWIEIDGASDTDSVVNILNTYR